MSLPYACIRDGTVIAHGTWCPTCETNTLTITPAGMTRPQYMAICRYFTHRGEINRARRMDRLTQLTGRIITDYWDLTQAEAAQCAAELRKWAHGNTA